jgi:predicted nucleic acid-binding protein
MAKRYLLDTDVIIEHLRGRDRAVKYMEALDGTLHLSAITIAELYAGVHAGEEEALERFLAAAPQQPTRDVTYT